MAAALFAQARFDRFAFCFGFRVAELLQQPFDRGVRVGQFFGGADGRRGDVVGRVVALPSLRRSGRRRRACRRACGSGSGARRSPRSPPSCRSARRSGGRSRPPHGRRRRPSPRPPRPRPAWCRGRRRRSVRCRGGRRAGRPSCRGRGSRPRLATAPAAGSASPAASVAGAARLLLPRFFFDASARGFAALRSPSTLRIRFGFFARPLRRLRPLPPRRRRLRRAGTSLSRRLRVEPPRLVRDHHGRHDSTARATPSAGISRAARAHLAPGSASGGEGMCRGRLGRRGKPAAARSSSSAVNSGRGVGRSSRSSVNRVSSSNRSIEGLSQLGHGAVDAGAGVRLADPEDRGDLGVAEAGEELERDQLALACLQPREPARRASRRSELLGARLDRGRVDVGRLGRELGLAAAAAQLVERRVAGDAEEPGARFARLGSKRWRLR